MTVAGPILRAGSVAVAGFVLAAIWIGLVPPMLARTGLAGGAGAGGEALFTIEIFLPLLVAAMVGGWSTGLPILRAGSGTGGWVALGTILGAAGVLVSASYARIAGTLVAGSSALPPRLPLLLAGTVTVLVQALAEEVYFRGWLQALLVRVVRPRVAVVVTAIGFALLHIAGGAHDMLALGNLFLGGLLFGLLAQAGGTIWPAAAAHFSWNAVEQLGLGLDPNPGVGGFGSVIDLDLIGPAVWGGSEQGLNASIGMTFAMLALLVPLLLLGRRQQKDRAVVA